MGTMRAGRWGVVAALLGSVAVACSAESDGGGASQGTVSTTAATTKATAPSSPRAEPDDRVPGARWAVEDPAAAGMDAAGLEEARRYAFAPERNTQGVVVVRHGAIVSEWYADGADADSWTASWSVAKSFSSAMAGIAVADGSIESVDDPASAYLDEWAGTDKADITVEDILHMQSGLAWDEDYQPSSADSFELVELGLSPDEVAYAAGRPGAEAPGSTWVYSSADDMILAGIGE